MEKIPHDRNRDDGHTQPEAIDTFSDYSSQAERRHLMDQARGLIVTLGRRHFSLDRLAGQCGVALAELQRHFGDDESLYRLVVTHLLDRCASLLPTGAPDGGTRRDTIIAFAAKVLRLLGGPEHRDLKAIVARDGEQLPWLEMAYQTQVNAQLEMRLERIWSFWQSNADSQLTAIEAQRAIALLRSILDRPDTALSIAEFADLIEARMVTMGQSGANPGIPLPDQQERRPMIKRGAITITFDPIEVRWNGAVVGLSPLEGQVFALLAQRGRVRWTEIDAVMEGAGASVRSRDVMLHRMRRKFDRAGAANPLLTIKGWGLRMLTEPDIAGTRTIWIGACEPIGDAVPLTLHQPIKISPHQHERHRQYHQ